MRNILKQFKPYNSNQTKPNDHFHCKLIKGKPQTILSEKYRTLVVKDEVLTLKIPEMLSFCEKSHMFGSFLIILFYTETLKS